MWIHVPVCTCHSLAVPSWLPLHTMFLSALKATDCTKSCVHDTAAGSDHLRDSRVGRFDHSSHSQASSHQHSRLRTLPLLYVHTVLCGRYCVANPIVLWSYHRFHSPPGNHRHSRAMNILFPYVHRRSSGGSLYEPPRA